MALPNKDQLIALDISYGATPFITVEAKTGVNALDISYNGLPFFGALDASTGANYTLTANSGSYALTGVNATFTKTKLIIALAGAYTLSGVSATITYTPVSVAYTLTALSGSYTLTGSNATLSYSGEATQSVAAADYSVKKSKKYIVRKDGQLLVFNSKQSALDTLNNDELDATSELNALIDIDMSESADVEPSAEKQSLQPTYDINLMLQTLRDNAQAEMLLNERKYQALLAMYERHIDEEEVELLLMAV